MTSTLSKIPDPVLAEDLAKLVTKNQEEGSKIVQEIKKKEVIKPEPTKAELSFKNMQEKLVSLEYFFFKLIFYI